MTDKTVVLRTFTNMSDALVAKQMLDDEQISCFINDSNPVQLQPMFSTPTGIKIVVFETDLAQADNILKSVDL